MAEAPVPTLAEVSVASAVAEVAKPTAGINVEAPRTSSAVLDTLRLMGNQTAHDKLRALGTPTPKEHPEPAQPKPDSNDGSTSISTPDGEAPSAQNDQDVENDNHSAQSLDGQSTGTQSEPNITPVQGEQASFPPHQTDRLAARMAQHDGEIDASRIYDRPADDPAVKGVLNELILRTISDPKALAPDGKNPVGELNKVEEREAAAAWDRFVAKYPDKAKAYSEKGYGAVTQALERKKLAESPAATESSNPQVESSKAAAEATAVEIPNADGEAIKTPEMEAEAQRKQMLEIGAELSQLGIDPTSPEGQEVFDMIAKNPGQMDAVRTTANALGEIKKLGEYFGIREVATQATLDTLNALIAELERQINESSPEDENPAAAEARKNRRILSTILKGMGSAMVAIAALPVATGVGLVALGAKAVGK